MVEPRPHRSSARRTRMPAPQRREQIIASAREVFLEQGFIGTRTRDIADRAGITEPFFYRFFGSKDEVYQEAVLAPLEALVQALNSKAAALADTVDGFSRRQLQDVNQMLLEHLQQAAPFLAVALFSEVGKGKQFYRTEVYPRLRDAIFDVLNALSGGRMTRFDRDIVFTMMFGVHFGIAMDHMLRDLPVDIEATAEQLTSLYAAGIRAPR